MDISKFQYSRKLSDNTVLLRLDLNVPVERRKILDDARIVAAMPTIEKLVERNAKTIIIAHLGRPNGKIDMKYTLAPVAERIGELLGKEVKFIDSSTMGGIKRSVRSVKAGQVALLENIRFHKGEVEGEDWFAESLADMGDIFVFDAFASAHRESPSLTGLATYLPHYGGYLLQSEITALEILKKTEKNNTVGVVGGKKVKTKLPLIDGLLNTCGKVLIGGAIINTYLKARGYTVGKSLVDDSLEFAAIQNMKRRAVVMPIDVVVGNEDGTQYRVVSVAKHDRLLALPDEKILDIGPKTIQKYSKILKEAQTIMWNGAMGYFEQSPYHIGTVAIARVIASREDAYTIVGGGETVQALRAYHLESSIDHVSTGGGAMLTYIEQGTLPAIEALKQ